jgi:hypothetical protein
MSIVTEARNRAEGALETGKQALGSAQKSAQARISDAVDTVTSVAEQAASRDVTVAGRTISFEALVADLEKLVKTYRDSANDRAESLVSDLKNDERLTKLVDRAEGILRELKTDKRVTQLVGRAETVYDALYETVQDRVVKPTKGLIGKAPVPTKRSAPAAKKATAAKKAPAAKAPVAKAPVKAAAKAAAKSAPTAKAAAKKAPAAKAVVAETTPAPAAATSTSA